MALADTGPAPYAPTSAISLVIDQYRERGLNFPLTTGSLERLGIEASLARRSLAALKQLDLIDKEGNATETLDKIKVAPTSELQAVLADWVRAVYKPIFQYADLGDVERVTDQFRHYEPGGMRNRMVSLFFGLCVKAGLIDKAPGQARGPSKAAGTRKTTATRTTKDKTKDTGAQPPPADDPPPRDSARDRYADFLLEKARAQEMPDPDLLDRIERALGIGGEAS